MHSCNTKLKKTLSQTRKAAVREVRTLHDFVMRFVINSKLNRYIQRLIKSRYGKFNSNYPLTTETCLKRLLKHFYRLLHYRLPTKTKFLPTSSCFILCKLSWCVLLRVHRVNFALGFFELHLVLGLPDMTFKEVASSMCANSSSISIKLTCSVGTWAATFGPASFTFC